MWAVTSYFNPMGCKYRKPNFELFRRDLGDLPLAVVEVVLPGKSPELGAGDAKYIRYVQGDCLWQKERALNLALAALPDDCDKVLIADADVVGFKPDEIQKALDTASVVHPYSFVEYLKPDGSVDFVWPSIVKRPTMFQAGDQVSHGIAWAFRRDFIERVRFHDRFIVGGADLGLSAALLGRAVIVPERHLMNRKRIDAYMKWALPLQRALEGNVVHTDAVIQHLWHGSEASRQYRTRKMLLEHFDPYTDVVAPDGQGLRWTPNPDARVQTMKARIERYFEIRAKVTTEDQTVPRGRT